MKKFSFIIVFAIAAALAGAAIYYSVKPLPANNPPQPQTKTVKVFYSNFDLGGGSTDCSVVFGLDRIVAKDSGYDQILRQLFAGPTDKETVMGYSSFFSSKTADILISVKVVDDTAYVNLKDIRSLIPNASASCGSAEFFAEVEKTLSQDGTIKNVIFAINADPAPFYEWIQIGCAPFNNNCDPAPFKQ